MASVLKAVFALAVNHTISVCRQRLIILRSLLHAQHWNPGRAPGFYKIPLPASLLSLCTHLVDLLLQVLAPSDGFQIPKLYAGAWLEKVCKVRLWVCFHSPEMLEELPQTPVIRGLPDFIRSHLQDIPHETLTSIHLSKSHEENAHLSTVKLRLYVFQTRFLIDSCQFYCRTTLLILVEVLPI